MAYGETACLMVFARRESDSRWRALYESRLTFTQVGNALATGETVRRAQEKCERGSGDLIIRTAQVPAWWTFQRSASVVEAFFTDRGGAVVVRAVTFFADTLPPSLEFDGADLRIVKTTCRAQD